MMMIEVEDAIKLLEELLQNKTTEALRPQELVHKQYALLGVVDGVKCCIRKLEELSRRESYNQLNP